MNAGFLGTALAAKLSSTVEQAFESALAAERHLGARRLNTGRLVIVGLFGCMFLILGYWRGDPNYRGTIDLWLLYLALAIATHWLGSRTRWAQRVGMLPVIAIDMPMIFALQVTLVHGYDDPGGLAGFTVGAYLFLLLLTVLSWAFSCPPFA